MDYSQVYDLDQAYQYQLSPTVSILTLIVSIFTLVCLWIIFEKAHRPGWAVLVPFYSLYKEFEIGLGNGWKFLWLFCPIANIIFAIKCLNGISHKFGKSTGFTVGLVFLPMIFFAILAFDKKTQYIAEE